MSADNLPMSSVAASQYRSFGYTWSRELGDPVDLSDSQFPELSFDAIAFDNCLAMDTAVGSQTTLSTPFVAAIAGTILAKFKDNPVVELAITQIVNHLARLVISTPSVGFFYDSNSEPDLDTTACVHTFLLKSGFDCYRENEDLRRELLRVLSGNKSPEEGAYRTWFYRSGERNKIDYMANVNLYVLFAGLDYHDESLGDYLVGSFPEFAAEGSCYYRDLDFPLFLLYFYSQSGLVQWEDRVFQTIREMIESNRYLASRIETIAAHYGRLNNPRHRDVKPLSFKRLFNSSTIRTKTYRSPILDTVIDAYLSRS